MSSTITLLLTVVCGTSEIATETVNDIIPAQSIATTVVSNGAEATPTLTNKEATKEYLESLPLVERMQAQWHLDQEEQEKLKHDARQQVKNWLAESRPKCQHFFGSGNCKPAIMELQPSKICGFKFHRRLSSIDELKSEGHYFVALVNSSHHTSGGYIWIASYGHQAYHNGAVLNITQCWAVNPSEVGEEPLPTKPPIPTSILNDWNPSR